MQSRRLEILEVEGSTFCRCLDRKLVDDQVIVEWADELLALVECEKKTRLMIDFANVTELSSKCLNKLIILDKRMKAIQGKIVLRGVAPDIYEVFLITRLWQLFTFVENDREALAAFRA